MYIVSGPATITEDRWVVNLNDPAAGLISGAASPAAEAFWGLAAVLHRALGQQPPFLTTTAYDRELVGIWLGAYGIRDVIVHHVDGYAADALAAFERVVEAAGAQFWAIVDPSIVDLVCADVAEHAPVIEVPWLEFHDRWADHRAGPGDSQDGGTLRLTGRVAWTTEYERLVRATQRTMDLPYLAGFCAAASWPRAKRPRKAEIAARLRARLASYGDPACLAQATRGAAVALHAIGWELTVDIRRLAGHVTGEPLAIPSDVLRLDDARAFRDPTTATPVVLASLDLTRDEILGLNIGDVAEDGGHVSLWHDVVEVPIAVRPILRAQRGLRLGEGATDGEPLLTRAGRRLSPRHFNTVVLAGLEELGRGIPKVELDERPAADERWLLERGIALRWTPRVDRRRASPADVDGTTFLARVVGRLGRPDQLIQAAGCSCSAAHDVPGLPPAGAWPPPPPASAGFTNPYWRDSALLPRDPARLDRYVTLPRPAIPKSGPGSVEEAMATFLRATAAIESASAD